jgi:prepilin-type N-terminal cleavage/methylation domain-containing protein
MASAPVGTYQIAILRERGYMPCRWLKSWLPLKCASCKQNGFTLIELMIVVGVIGILVSIAGPQFNKYQRKARQSEAKINLGATYSLEKSFYSEYGSYVPSFDAIGYVPEGYRRFYSVSGCWNCRFGPWVGTVTGYAGTISTQVYPTINTPYTQVWNDTGSCSSYEIGTWAFTNDPQVFGTAAIGNIYEGGIMDIWIINESKILVNCQVGL